MRGASIKKGNPQSLVQNFRSPCSCRRYFGLHDLVLFLTALSRSIPIRPPLLAAASLLGERVEANHLVPEKSSCPVQVPVGISILLFILLISIYYFFCAYVDDKGG